MSRRWYRRVLSDILSVGLNLLFKTPNNVADSVRHRSFSGMSHSWLGSGSVGLDLSSR